MAPALLTVVAGAYVGATGGFGWVGFAAVACVLLAVADWAAALAALPVVGRGLPAGGIPWDEFGFGGALAPVEDAVDVAPVGGAVSFAGGPVGARCANELMEVAAPGCFAVAPLTAVFWFDVAAVVFGGAVAICQFISF